MTEKNKRLLITAALLAALAIVLCLTATLLAKKNNVVLFKQTQNEEGNFVYTYDFAEENIKKISLDISYTDVNIIGGAEKCRIELINFAEENFRMTVSATTIAVEEKSGLAGLVSLNFGGLRNHLNSFRMLTKAKTINIYLTDTSVMKLLETDIYSGNINLENCNLSCDYNIKVKYGSVAAASLSSDGAFDVTIYDGNLDISNSEFASHSAAITRGYENIVFSRFTTLKSEIETGYFKYETGKYSLLSSVLRLSTDTGRVRFGGDIYENGSFSQGMKYTGISSVLQVLVEVHVSDGNIMITE